MLAGGAQLSCFRRLLLDPLSPLLPTFLLPLAELAWSPQWTHPAARPHRLAWCLPSPHRRNVLPGSQGPPASWTLALQQHYLHLQGQPPGFSAGSPLMFPTSCFTFSASWSPSFMSATSVEPCLKCNLFSPLNPLERILCC